MRVQGPMHYPDRLGVHLARRVVLALPLVLQSDDAAEQDEVDDTIVDVPGRSLSRVQLGELDVDPCLRVSGETGFDLVEENLAYVAAAFGHEASDLKGEGGWVYGESGHVILLRNPMVRVDYPSSPKTAER